MQGTLNVAGAARSGQPLLRCSDLPRKPARPIQLAAGPLPGGVVRLGSPSERQNRSSASASTSAPEPCSRRARANLRRQASGSSAKATPNRTEDNQNREPPEKDSRLDQACSGCCGARGRARSHTAGAREDPSLAVRRRPEPAADTGPNGPQRPPLSEQSGHERGCASRHGRTSPPTVGDDGRPSGFRGTSPADPDWQACAPLSAWPGALTLAESHPIHELENADWR